MSERVITRSTQPAGPRFYNVAEVAQIFGTSRMTIYRAIREGQLPVVRVRGRLFVPARALDELVDAAVGFERVAAWAMARQQELLAAFHRRPDDGSIRPVSPRAASRGTAAPCSSDTRAWAADEFALALTLAPTAAAVRMAHGDRLDAVLRPTRDLLGCGKICPARARLIADMLAEYDDEVTAQVQARVLPRAPEQTVGQLRSALPWPFVADLRALAAAGIQAADGI